ncbi:MAG TPA: LysR family transcriptional regulator [Paraburkholderia sp.]|nr:LysR family transcriptional regulator [Paraburkholderia sp.]
MLFSEEINTFLAVVHSGSLLQAAEIVCTTQSTVSYRIQSLERRIGHALILRSRGSRRIALTTDGERFLDIAERWKMLEIEAEQLKATNDRYLAIGAVDAVAIHVLPSFLTALSQEQPAIRLHLESGRYWQLANRVASGHLSLAFALSPAEHADLMSVQLNTFPMLIAYVPGEGGALEPEADMTAFDPSREVYLPWSAELDIWRTRRGLSRLVNSVDKSHMLAPLLQRSGAWALIPAFMAEALRTQTGCSVHTLKYNPPPALPLFKISKRVEGAIGERDQASIETALIQLTARN